jgi:DNA (cytosine-5)-methyltransferase 1
MTCNHDKEKLGFRCGDTVLAAVSLSNEFSERYEVVKVFRQGELMFVRLRKLLWRNEIDPDAKAPPSKLAYILMIWLCPSRIRLFGSVW